MKSIEPKNKTIIGYFIIGFCFMAFAALATSALVLRGGEYDQVTFCPETITSHSIVVLDKTDSLSPNQQMFVRQLMREEKKSFKTFEKFSVFTLTEDIFSSSESVFSRCNPGRGRDANRLYQNPRKIQMQFDKAFSEPLHEIVNSVLLNGSSARTPILEVIRQLSLRDDFSDKVENRVLIIISDMMHHMPNYSQYKKRVDYKKFSKQPYAFSVKANLNSVNVRIIYLIRENLRQFQGKQHLSFWKEYFEDMGANVVEVRKVF